MDCDGRRPHQRARTRPQQATTTNGGPTDLDNLTLLCGYHHRNFEALGWACQMTDGVPEWLPPRWLDPEQKPIRNTAHHIEIDFDTG